MFLLKIAFTIEKCPKMNRKQTFIYEKLIFLGTKFIYIWLYEYNESAQCLK